MVAELEVVADHFQFLVGDSAAGILADTTSLWRSRGVLGQIEESPEIVGIGTIRSGGRTKVVVTVGGKSPAEGAEGRVLGQFRLRLPSGIAVLWGPSAVDLSGAPSVRVPPGTYLGVATLRWEDQVSDEEAEEGPEEYWLRLEGPIADE
jgi:hypothetical protein